MNRVITSPSATTEGDLLSSVNEVAPAALAPLFVLTTGADSDEDWRGAKRLKALDELSRKLVAGGTRLPSAFSFCQAFSFAPPSAKRKSGERFK